MSLTADATLVLENGLILRDPSTGEVEVNERIIISDGAITKADSLDGRPLFSGQIIDCSNCLIMPGLVNCHVHSAMSVFRGLADDLPLDMWLNELIFPCEAKHVSREMVRLGSTLSIAEMALSGITTFSDAYFFMEESALAAMDIGLRSVVGQGILDIPSPDTMAYGSWQERVHQFFESIPSCPTISPTLFCHSPYLCKASTFHEASAICKSHGAKLGAHVAETMRENQLIRARHGVSPVELLQSIGVLDNSFVAVHCVHLTGKDMEILRDAHVNVVHCPESNMKLASGAARIKDLLKMGLTVGLGTDSPASNNNLDLFEEMRSASLLAKLVSSDPEALNAKEALTMATIGGAMALGLDGIIGTLTPGKQADIIVIDMNQPHFQPLYNPISQLVYCARGCDVRDVIVAGRQIVRDRKLCSSSYDDARVQILKLAKKIAFDAGRTIFLTQG